MARLASGSGQLEAAKELLKTAKTAEEMRGALAVVLPLEYGFSIEQTARVIGRCPRTTCTLRTRVCRELSGEGTPKRGKRALRNRAKTTLENEARILEEVLQDASSGGVVIVPPLKSAIEAKLGKQLAISTVYQMLARHGWRKIAPDRIHPKGDPSAQEVWKKNSRAGWRK